MYKNISSLILTSLLIPGAIFGMTPETPAEPNKLQTEKVKIERELKANRAKLKKFKTHEKLSPAISKIEAQITKVVTSAEFKSIIEAMTTKQAQDIAQGKTFEELKYNHSLSNEFPKIAGNTHKLLAQIYSFMANIEHYQLLLTKLNSTSSAEIKEAAQTSTETAPTKETTPSPEQ